MMGGRLKGLCFLLISFLLCGIVRGTPCGQSWAEASRIIAGSNAKEGAWPWMASISYDQFENGNLDHFCGATLIHPAWLLTAAHCVDLIKGAGYRNISQFRVIIGDTDRQKTTYREQVFKINRMVPHPKWGDQSGWHDIALIQLSRPIIFTRNVFPACLPNASIPLQKTAVCYLTGWGFTVYPSVGLPVDILQQAKLPIVNSSHCFNMKELICAGYGTSSSTNACEEDSGGPLACRMSNGRWSVQGVASFVVEMCKKYTAFVDVRKYLKWINKTIY